MGEFAGVNATLAVATDVVAANFQPIGADTLNRRW